MFSTNFEHCARAEIRRVIATKFSPAGGPNFHPGPKFAMLSLPQSVRSRHFARPFFWRVVGFRLDFSHSSRSILANVLFCICFWSFRVPIEIEF